MEKIELNSGDSWNDIVYEHPWATLSDCTWEGSLEWYVSCGFDDNDNFFRTSWDLGYSGQDLAWDGGGVTTDDMEYATGMAQAGFEVTVC